MRRCTRSQRNSTICWLPLHGDLSGTKSKHHICTLLLIQSCKRHSTCRREEAEGLEALHQVAAEQHDLLAAPAQAHGVGSQGHPGALLLQLPDQGCWQGGPGQDAPAAPIGLAGNQHEPAARLHSVRRYEERYELHLPEQVCGQGGSGQDAPVAPIGLAGNQCTVSGVRGVSCRSLTRCAGRDGASWLPLQPCLAWLGVSDRLLPACRAWRWRQENCSPNQGCCWAGRKAGWLRRLQPDLQHSMQLHVGMWVLVCGRRHLSYIAVFCTCYALHAHFFSHEPWLQSARSSNARGSHAAAAPQPHTAPSQLAVNNNMSEINRRAGGTCRLGYCPSTPAKAAKLVRMAAGSLLLLGPEGDLKLPIRTKVEGGPSMSSNPAGKCRLWLTGCDAEAQARCWSQSHAHTHVCEAASVASVGDLGARKGFRAMHERLCEATFSIR